MNFIKDTKDLVSSERYPYNDEEVAKQLMESIQFYVDDGSSKITIYEKSIPKDNYDWEYEYVKRHKKELKSKGYKIHAIWPPFIGYTVSWRIKK